MHYQRQAFDRLATAKGVPFTILDVHCPEQVLRSRIQKRLVEAKDPSEATVKVLETQLQVAQPLSADERKRSVIVQSGDGDTDITGLVRRIVSA